MFSEQEEVLNTPTMPDIKEAQGSNKDSMIEVFVEYEEPEQTEFLEKPIGSTSVDEDDSELKAISENDTKEEGGREVITPKPNRELKLLLALSKEANLDTNMARKRKSIEPQGKSEVTQKRRYSTGSNLGLKLAKTEEDDESLKDEQSKTLIDVNLKADSMSNTEEDFDETKEKDYSSNKGFKKVIGGAVDENGRRTKKLSNNFITMNDEKKDPFCWQCHHEDSNLFCKSCPRSFHQKCVRQNVLQPNHWMCPECVTIMQAENLKQRSSAMKEMTLVHLCVLLKFAMKRMLQVAGCEPFIQPVNDGDFPEYKQYIVHPMDITCLEKNIKRNLYGSPQAFEADAKWILHNSIIFNSYQSKLTSTAKSMMKILKQEMVEIENCATCYLNANTKKKTWFVEVCPKPHIVVWAKLKGFPYWPAKAMRANSGGMVDVRFFGAHDRAWVHFKDCFLFSLKDPNSNKQKRNDIIESVKELQLYVDNLKKVYGEFRYAPYRTQFEPDEIETQLQTMLPNYPNKLKSRKLSNKMAKTNGAASVNDDHESKEAIEKQNDKQLNSDPSDEDDLPIEMHSKLNATYNNDSCSDHNSITDDDNTSKSPFRGGNVRMRGGVTNTSGKLKIFPKLLTPDNNSKKRLSTDEIDTPNKLIRCNSDQSNLSLLSNSSDKFNDIENKEGNKSNISENILDTKTSKTNLELASESKSDAIINLGVVENSKISKPPPNKSKIADRLMEKLLEPDNLEFDKPAVNNSTEHNVSEPDLLLEKFKDQVLTVLEKITELSPDTEIFETTNKDVSDKNNCETTNTGDECGDFICTEVELEDKDNILLNSEINFNIDSNIDDTIINEDITKNSNTAFESVSVESHETNEHVEHIKDSVVTSASTKEIINVDKTSNKNDVVEAVSIPSSSQNDNGISQSTAVSPNVLPENKDNAQKLDKNVLGKSALSVNSEPELLEEWNPAIRTTKSIKNDETPNVSSFKRSMITMVNIEDIRKKNLNVADNNESMHPPVSTQSILENRLGLLAKTNNYRRESNASDRDHSYNMDNDSGVIVVKSEPSSEDEPSDSEYLEKKRKYLSALNISERMPEKPKHHEIRTRSKTEERKIADNISKVIDDVATHYSLTHSNNEITITPAPKRKEIFIKPLSTLQDLKQRARKSFPTLKNVYAGSQKKDAVKVCKSIVTPLISVKCSSSAMAVVSKPPESTTNNVMMLTQTPTFTSAIALLPPNQPITYTNNVAKPMLTMIQHPVASGVFLQQATVSLPLTCASESQNYIPQSGATSKAIAITAVSRSSATLGSTNNSVVSAVTNIAPSPTVVASVASNNDSTMQSNNVMDDINILSSSIPEHLTRAISDIMCRTPPKLKPRPPGPLSTQFNEGLPSGAGNVTSKVNSISHRLNDYFRGMLIELLQDIGSSSNPEAEITKLKLENEELKHRHAEEILEIKKNISSVLKDMQKSLADEKNRVVEETRSTCELETVKRVEEAKSKQWCANCSKEAQFYCCWNTSYCDYPCQQKHWPAHMPKCTQHIQNSQLQTLGSTTTMKTSNQQPLVLRPTTVPKGFKAKTIIGKPTKVLVNRPTMNKVPFTFARTQGSHITLVESTPGNYELVGNGGPISVGGKIIANIGKLKSGSVLSVTSTSTSSIDPVTGTIKKSPMTPTPTVLNSPRPINSIPDSGRE